MRETWNYASIVGMLLYLSTNTRTDIAFAVSQVARFTSSPKQSHASAVKSIVRYLAGTIDKGMIMRPDGTMNINAYVDADFAGLYSREPDDKVEAALIVAHPPGSRRPSRRSWRQSEALGAIHAVGVHTLW